MPIPVYFVISGKEAASFTDKLLAQSGFGFHSDGSLRLPAYLLENVIPVIDDAILPEEAAITEEAIKTLANYCKNGCILDFEQAPKKAHRFTRRLAEALPSDTEILLPASYRVLLPKATPIFSCQNPVNHWERFLAEVHHEAKNWYLELLPWNCEFAFCCKQTVAQTASKNNLIYSSKEETAFYSENKKTVQKRLLLAAQYGCIGAIGILNEIIQYI